MLTSDVYDLTSENIDDPEDFRPVFGFGDDLDQCHLSLNVFRTGQIVDLDDINELVKLFFDLFNNRGFPCGDQRNS